MVYQESTTVTIDIHLQLKVITAELETYLEALCSQKTNNQGRSTVFHQDQLKAQINLMILSNKRFLLRGGHTVKNYGSLRKDCTDLISLSRAIPKPHNLPHEMTNAPIPGRILILILTQLKDIIDGLSIPEPEPEPEPASASASASVLATA